MKVEIDGPTRLPKHCRMNHAIQIIVIEAVIQHQKRITRWKRCAFLMIGDNKLLIIVNCIAKGNRISLPGVTADV